MSGLRNAAVATAIGITGAVVISAVPPRLTHDLNEAMNRLDGDAVWVPAGLLLLLGVVIGFFVLAATWHPLAGLIPAVVLLVLYPPFYVAAGPPQWIPDRWEQLVFELGSQAAPVMAGVLISASVVPIVVRAVRPTVATR